jgi:hypothetical protein
MESRRSFIKKLGLGTVGAASLLVLPSAPTAHAKSVRGLVLPATANNRPAHLPVRKVGMAGGGGGQEFVDDALPNYARVLAVYVASGNVVDSVQIVVEDDRGIRHEYPMHGGDGGRLHEFTLDADEYIIGLSGRSGAWVDQLQIFTNKQSSPVYGCPGGDPFEYSLGADEEMTGFWGRAGNFVDAIGMIVRSYGG